MPQKLTKSLLERLSNSPPRDRLMLYDTELPGFGIRITPNARTFFAQYRVGSGRAAPKRRISLGRYGALTVDEARRLARQALADAAQGNDPAADRARLKAAPTVAAVGKDFLDDVDARRKASTAREYRRLWHKHVVPALGGRKVAELSSVEVSRLHRSMRSTPFAANRVLALVGSFFSFAEQQTVRPRHSNPARDVKPYPERSRERFLSAVEVARLGDALARAESVGLPPAPNVRSKKRGISRARMAKLTGRKRGPYKTASTLSRVQPANPFSVAAIRFLLLTGWRESEALGLKWSDVDTGGGRITLHDTKTGKSFRVIGAPARLVLSELSRVAECPYVFPRSDGEGPLSDVTRVWYAVRHAAGLDDVRLHDLRHSFASVSASSGGSLLVIGKLLGHRDASTTAKYAHLFDDPIKAAAEAASAQLATWLNSTAAAGVSGAPLRIAK